MRPSAAARTGPSGRPRELRTYPDPSSLWCMGLLDDAIREHLDLKRRRGADPAEVERAEREALGPVRRNPSLADADPAEDQTAPGDGFAYDQAEEDGWPHDSLQEPEAGAAEPLDEEPD